MIDQSRHRRHYADMAATVSIRFSAVLFITLITVSCFDYAEKIILTKDLSGRVEFDYTVPVHKGTGKSVISYLPADEASVHARYRNLFRKEIFKVEDLIITEESPLPGPFAGRRRVRYSVSFRDPADLKHLIAGANVIVSEKGRLRMERTFPVLRQNEKKPGFIMSRFDSLTRSLLENHYAEFSIVIPAGYTLQSSLEVVSAADTYVLRFPVLQYQDKGEPLRWNLSIAPVLRIRGEKSETPSAEYQHYEADS